MYVYTIEISGRPIASWNVSDPDERFQLYESTAFRGDLMTYTDKDGSPLWDGKSQILLRDANDIELKKFNESYRYAKMHGELESDESIWLMYHVAVVDPVDDPD